MSDADVIRRQTFLGAGRFAVTGAVPTMKAVVTTGHGGLDRLHFTDVPVPVAGPGEVLLRVLAAGVNATDVNTRLGWYGSSLAPSADRAGGRHGTAGEGGAPPPGLVTDGGWAGPVPFPLIQGTDCCGRVEAVGPGVDADLLGRRALVRPCMRPSGFSSMETVWLGSDLDGAFAQFVTVPASEVFAVDTALRDEELGALPCAYGTAANMLRRARIAPREHVLVSGASGGVGSATVQLAKLRGATVTALAGRAKTEQVRALGADDVVASEDDLMATIGEMTVDVVVDNVSGPAFGAHVQLLRRGGRYVSSGAVAGAVVSFDKRTFYLRDLTFIGCTAWDEPVFPELIASVQRGEIKPLVAATYPLERIAEAQTALLERRAAGKIVLVPPRA